MKLPTEYLESWYGIPTVYEKFKFLTFNIILLVPVYSCSSLVNIQPDIYIYIYMGAILRHSFLYDLNFDSSLMVRQFCLICLHMNTILLIRSKQWTSKLMLEADVPFQMNKLFTYNFYYGTRRISDLCLLRMKLYISSSVLCNLVKWTLVQALRLSTGRTAHKGSRSIALPFLDHGTRRG